MSTLSMRTLDLLPHEFNHGEDKDLPPYSKVWAAALGGMQHCLQHDLHEPFSLSVVIRTHNITTKQVQPEGGLSARSSYWSKLSFGLTNAWTQERARHNNYYHQNTRWGHSTWCTTWAQSQEKHLTCSHMYSILDMTLSLLHGEYNHGEDTYHIMNLFTGRTLDLSPHATTWTQSGGGQQNYYHIKTGCGHSIYRNMSLCTWRTCDQPPHELNHG